jgi:hypothetical protein
MLASKLGHSFGFGKNQLGSFAGFCLVKIQSAEYA